MSFFWEALTVLSNFFHSQPLDLFLLLLPSPPDNTHRTGSTCARTPKGRDHDPVVWGNSKMGHSKWHTKRKHRSSPLAFGVRRTLCPHIGCSRTVQRRMLPRLLSTHRLSLWAKPKRNSQPKFGRLSFPDCPMISAHWTSEEGEGRLSHPPIQPPSTLSPSIPRSRQRINLSLPFSMLSRIHHCKKHSISIIMLVAKCKAEILQRENYTTAVII